MRKTILLIVSSLSAFAQNSFTDSLIISTEAGIISATDNTPFLLRSKKYGVVPLESNLFYINTRLVREYSPAKKFDFGFGLEPHINVSKKTEFLLPEAYVQARYKALELYVGRKREVFGLVDTVGTMGSYAWSGNALPVPKIDIGIRQFTPIVKSGLLAIKGNFAHGWLGSGDSVQNVLLHQKSLYVRLGKPAWKIKLIAGINHQAQWGGKPTVPYYDEISGQTIEKYDVSFQNYLRVLTGVSIGEQTKLEWDEVTGLPANEAGNRVGNHVGSIDLGTQFEIGKFTVLVYRQSIFEDGSLFYLSNISDGLTGMGISGPNKFKFTIEYLNTKNQGGPIYYGNIPELRGVDNYFNNSVYRDSWTYKGKVIGVPLLNPYYESPAAFVEYERKFNTNYIYNNRVAAININSTYLIHRKYITRSQLIFSQNYGHYKLPINNKQYSWLQAASVPFKNLLFTIELSGDHGKYLPNSIGANVGVKKIWH